MGGGSEISLEGGGGWLAGFVKVRFVERVFGFARYEIPVGFPLGGIEPTYFSNTTDTRSSTRASESCAFNTTTSVHCPATAQLSFTPGESSLEEGKIVNGRQMKWAYTHLAEP